MTSRHFIVKIVSGGCSTHLFFRLRGVHINFVIVLCSHTVKTSFLPYCFLCIDLLVNSVQYMLSSYVVRFLFTAVPKATCDWARFNFIRFVLVQCRLCIFICDCNLIVTRMQRLWFFLLYLSYCYYNYHGAVAWDYIRHWTQLHIVSIGWP